MNELRARELLDIARALKKKRAKPFQYAVHTFGFCTLCNRVTEYKGIFTKGWCSLRCLRCDGTFGDEGDHSLAQYVIDEVKVPAFALTEMKKMRSRRIQRQFLKAELRDIVRTGRSQRRLLTKELKPLEKLIKNL